jgi:hypothetical protein
VAKRVVLLHLPEKGNDPAGLWPQVETAAGDDLNSRLLIPQMGEIITL